MSATRAALQIGVLATLAACSAERLLAVANAPGSGGSAGGAGGNPNGAGGSPSDAGQSTPFGTPQLVTGLRSDTDDVQDPSLTFEQLELYFASPTGGGQPRNRISPPLEEVWRSGPRPTADDVPAVCGGLRGWQALAPSGAS